MPVYRTHTGSDRVTGPESVRTAVQSDADATALMANNCVPSHEERIGTGSLLVGISVKTSGSH